MSYFTQMLFKFKRAPQASLVRIAEIQASAYGVQSKTPKYKVGEHLELKLNQGSSSTLDAISVSRRNGELLGYLERSCGAIVREELQRGMAVQAVAGNLYMIPLRNSQVRYTIEVGISILAGRQDSLIYFPESSF